MLENQEKIIEFWYRKPSFPNKKNRETVMVSISADEFQLMVDTVGPYGSSSGSAGLSTTSGAGPETYYWTSSQSTSNSTTWAFRYNMGLNNLGINYGSKNQNAKVRAIRSF